MLEDVFKGWGRASLEGLRRFESLMNFLVVRFSQIDVDSEVSSSSLSVPAMRLSVDEEELCLVVLMCLRSAVEALNTCTSVKKVEAPWSFRSTYLLWIELVRRATLGPDRQSIWWSFHFLMAQVLKFDLIS